tara:strand:- start:38 stop:262 length:225 start_codon:yes stop_codon:yes gene_type:complete
MKFKKGDIVKSKLRTNPLPIYLLVLEDPLPSEIQFNAVVLYDPSDTYDKGDIANNWNTKHFEECEASLFFIPKN